MSASGFLSSSRVLIVAGKGGVGKTTLGATLGLAAARLGMAVSVIELEGHSTLGRSLGVGPLTYEPALVDGLDPTVGGTLEARRITPDEALSDYLRDHGFGRITHRLLKSGAIDVVSTAAPGIRDLLALGKIRQLEQSGEHDLIVVDAPAAGHAITFLRAPAGLAATSSSGPLRDQAELALELVSDETRCRTMLVTLPEETPVNEVVETAFSLEDDVGVKLAPVVVNGVWPVLGDLDALLSSKSRQSWLAKHPEARPALEFRAAQQRQQQAERARLADELPLPQLELPHQFTTRISRSHLEKLAKTLTDQLDGLDTE